MDGARWDTLTAASEAARTLHLRERACCYVVRADRVLVFAHVPDGGAGIQIPAGGVEPGEHPAAAAVREVREETGLHCEGRVEYLASRFWSMTYKGQEKRVMRHYFALQAPTDAPWTWEHFAEGKYIFRHRFAPLDSTGLDWQLGEELPALRAHLALARSPV